MTDPIALVKSEFARLFKAQPRVFRAPGRVNLIGEHTDYNDGFVMPAAIEMQTWVAAAARNDRKLAVHSVDFRETREFDLDGAHPQRAGHWSDYVRGVALALEQAGFRVGGANLVLHGNVPLGAGLSSSASVEMATAFALTALSGDAQDRVRLALACQHAENEFVGARCGIMDQFISANGQRGHALLLDCRSLAFEAVPLPAGVSLVICNTMVKHTIAGGEYNQRRAQCEEGVRILQGAFAGIRALRDVSAEQLEQQRDRLPKVIYRRCRHVVAENARVLAARDAFRRGDVGRVGVLMAQSHRSLQEDFAVSCGELDTMVRFANDVAGTIGARMTGGGFGGCTINLVREDAVERFRAAVSAGYERHTGRKPEIYVSAAGDGAGEVKSG